MKKLLIALLTALLLAASAFAAETDPSTPLRFGTSATVYSIDAVYAVKTEGLAAVDVTFADGLSFAADNYADGKLKMAIASPDPLDLSGSVSQVTATLENGAKATPVLELVSLKYNGVRATENLIPTSVFASASGDSVTVSVSAHNDYTGNAYQVLAAACLENGQMLVANIVPTTFAEKDVSLSVPLPGCRDADEVRVFFVTRDFRPVTGVWTTTVS